MTIQSSPCSRLVNSEGNPTQELLALLSELSIDHDGSLDSIVEATQKEQPEGFMRAKDKERWELASFYEDKKETIIQHAKRLELVDDMYPKKATYTYAVLLGGVMYRVHDRLGFLADIWRRGVSWEKLIVLTGNRPLDAAVESEEQLGKANEYLEQKENWQFSQVPQTEAEMMKMIIEQSELPDEWDDIPVEFIVSPMKQNGARPSTIDTVQTWLSKNPQPGSVLAVSNQPFIGYQGAVLRSQIEPKEFTLEVVGRKAKNTTPEILLDTIARCLYSIKQ